VPRFDISRKVTPDRSYHAQGAILFELEGVFTGMDVHNISHLEDRLEANSLLANIACGIALPSFCAATNLADRLDVSGRKPDFIAVYPEIVIV
jgi:hypothetical protein